MNELYKAKYMLALANNEMQDSVRSEYLESLSSDDAEVDYQALFLLLVSSVLRGYLDTENYVSDTAKARIETEFQALSLSENFGDYESYRGLIDLLVDSCRASLVSHSDLINLYDQFSQIADTMDETFKAGIYHAILVILVNKASVLHNISFTSRITSYIDSVEITEEMRQISGVITLVLFTITVSYG